MGRDIRTTATRAISTAPSSKSFTRGFIFFSSQRSRAHGDSRARRKVIHERRRCQQETKTLRHFTLAPSFRVAGKALFRKKPGGAGEMARLDQLQARILRSCPDQKFYKLCQFRT